MKRLILVFLFVGIAVFYFGCSENNPTLPELNQSEQPTSLAKNKTDFTGTSNFVQPLDPGTTTQLRNGKTKEKGRIAEWYDDASDWRVTGSSFWTVNSIYDEEGNGKVGGKAYLLVDDPNDSEADPVGRWEISWHGWRTGLPQNGNLYIHADAIGTGKEGVVKGMVAKSTFILDQQNVGFYYVSEGYVLGH